MQHCNILVDDISKKTSENVDDRKILDINEIASKALMWAYQLTHWYHFDAVESVSEINTQDLNFTNYSFYNITKIINNQEILIHSSYTTCVNRLPDRWDFFLLPAVTKTVTDTISYQIKYGIDIYFNFYVDIIPDIYKLILKLQLSHSCQGSITEKYLKEISTMAKKIYVPPYSKKRVNYQLHLVKNEYDVSLNCSIGGKISGIINLKLGKKINFAVNIGFAIYCLEIMNEAPIGVFASENQKEMIFRSNINVKKNIGSHFSIQEEVSVALSDT